MSHLIPPRFNFRFTVGKNPLNVAAPALIFFPFLSDTFCCGFAGLLTIRFQPSVDGEKSKNSGQSKVKNLTEIFSKASLNDLQALFSRKITSSIYLGGPETQLALQTELQSLKEEENWEQIFYDPKNLTALESLSEKMNSFLVREEKLLEEKAGTISTSALEEINIVLVMLRDLAWGLKKDLIENVDKICNLAGKVSASELSLPALCKYRKLNFLLNSLDRLEVRGRDSAGLQISFVPENNAELDAVLGTIHNHRLSDQLARRISTGDSVDGSIDFSPEAAPGDHPRSRSITFTYKTAEIIGKLGRNVCELRKKISEDSIFHLFSPLKTNYETAFAHTRWASVGSITEENCHPIGNFTLPVAQEGQPKEKYFPIYGKGFWTINVVLNGDIDNYQQLREFATSEGVMIVPELTTDTKIIPLRIEHHLRRGHDLAEAFRMAVLDFEGSHAIAMTSSLEPGKIFLALKGSGQSIYIGIAPDRYLFSSELYGFVEETPFFIKMDGEKEPPGGNSHGRGQIFILDQDCGGGVEGIKAFHYDKTPITLSAEAIRKAEITTRDIDRGGFPHYFLKEIGESVLSVRKTLQGKYRFEREENREKAVFSLGEDVIPLEIRNRLAAREIKKIYVIGHGTAAVAGSAIADAFERHLSGNGMVVQATMASELSGFCLEDDLSDSLVIPVTQSGTTTDTNRAVTMLKERGAKIIAIVNRRQSDITEKADGVFYTSDGRDIEMAVASTKAFYSQIIAGNVLSLAIASIVSSISPEQVAAELHTLERAPALMLQVLSKKEQIRAATEKTIKNKRYWAIVGSGPNKAAADEIRIKLSELCYLTISSDIVENKKHIDLSAEPLIIVCASGSPERVVGDIVKDVAIFKAHKSSVVVFADENERRFDSVATEVIPLPKSPLPLSVILNTVAGHLFGYYAACAIDEDALFLREFKSRLNLAMVDLAKKNISAYQSYFDEGMRTMINNFAGDFFTRRNLGSFSQGSIRTISDLTLLLKYGGGKLPLDDFRHDFPQFADLSPVDLLDVTLGRAIDELARPIDAIRHQAKTVTVGTSRKEELPPGPISKLLQELSFQVNSIYSSNLIKLDRIQRAVMSVAGYTLYAIDRLDVNGRPVDDTTIKIIKRGGISLHMRSRAENTTALVGTKKGIVSLGRIYAGLGKTDAAPLVIIPLLGHSDRIENLLLIHVVFNENLPVRERIRVIGRRVNKIKDLIQECNLFWSDELLADIPIGVLLGESADSIVNRIKMKDKKNNN